MGCIKLRKRKRKRKSKIKNGRNWKRKIETRYGNWEGKRGKRKTRGNREKTEIVIGTSHK
jgi:hypothetical protein